MKHEQLADLCALEEVDDKNQVTWRCKLCAYGGSCMTDISNHAILMHKQSIEVCMLITLVGEAADAKAKGTIRDAT